MPLENIQYDAIMREYGRRQLLSRHRLEEHRAHAQERIPRLKEIQDAIASASAQQIHSLLGGEKAGSTAVYREKVEALARERLPSRLPGSRLRMPCLPGHRVCKRPKMHLLPQAGGRPVPPAVQPGSDIGAGKLCTLFFFLLF